MCEKIEADTDNKKIVINRYIELVRTNVLVVNLIKILTLRMGKNILYKRENLNRIHSNYPTWHTNFRNLTILQMYWRVGIACLEAINFLSITQKCYVHIRKRKAEKSVTVSLDEFQLLIDMKNSIVEIGKKLISVVSLISNYYILCWFYS